MSKVLWIIFGVVVVGVITLAVLFGTGILGEGKTSNKISVDGFTWNQIITEANIPETFESDMSIVTDLVLGNVNSSVVLIEWANFQCSACYSLFPVMREVFDTYQDHVAFVHRYLYLSGHPNGLAAQVAAEAAALQGKYNEMSDLLFINSYAGDSWKDATTDKRKGVFQAYAESLGLDVQQWSDDYDNYEANGIKARTDFQNDLGLKNGVDATPYILVNGEKITGTRDGIISALDKALGL